MSEEAENTLGHNWTQLEVRDFVARCFDRDALLTALLGYASQWLAGRLICVVTKERIQPFMSKGWDSWGSDDETTAEMSEVMLEIASSETMSLIINEGIYTVGTPEELGLSPLFEEVSVLTPDQLAVIPLQLGSRTRMLLLGEPRVELEDMEQFSDELEPLIDAASEITTQLEDIIKLAKAGKLPEEDKRIPALPKSVQERLERGATRRERLLKERSQVDEDVEIDEDASPGDVPEDAPGSEASSEATPVSDVEDAPEAHFEELSEEPSEESLIAAISSVLEQSEPALDLTRRPLSRSDLDNAFESREETGSRKRSTAMLSALNAPRKEVPEESLEETSEERRKTTRMEPVLREPQGTQQHPALSAAQEGGVSSTASGNPSQIISTVEDDEPELEEARPMGTTNHGMQSPFRETGSQESVEPEEEGVSIIAPIGIAAEGSESKRTLMGGFSIEDIRRAQELYRSRGDQLALDIARGTKQLVDAPEPASPAPSAAPKALILKRRRKKRNGAAKPAAPAPSEATKPDKPLMSKATQLIHSVTKEPDSFHTTQLLHPTDVRPPEETSRVEPVAGPDFEPVAGFTPPDAETLKMKSVGVELSQGIEAPAQDILLMLDSRDREVAFQAADEVARHPALLDTLEEMFPGRLFVDRYMHQFGVGLPPVGEHGPVLRAMSQMGEAAVPTLERLLHSSSLDARFYATYLLTEIDAPELLEALYERLFDRDAQTRSVAFRVVTSHKHAPNFEAEILEPMRQTVREERDDLRVEYAAELLGEVRDIESIQMLIETMERHRQRTSRVIHKALQQIALQPLPAAMIAWRQWYQGAGDEGREEWMLRALNSNSQLLREMVAQELEELDGLELNYHPDQPPSLRIRAQQQLKEWLDQRD